MKRWMPQGASMMYEFPSAHSSMSKLIPGQKVAKQLAQTDALLNKYVEILHRSEDVSRLIFDEDWQGAEAVSLGSSLFFLQK